MNGSVVRMQRFTWNSCTVCTVYTVLCVSVGVSVGIIVGSTKCHCRVLHRHTFTVSAQLPAQIQHRSSTVIHRQYFIMWNIQSYPQVT